MNDPTLYPADPILLIDDETSWLHSLSLNLQFYGNFNHLTTCSDSREALGLLRSRPFSAVLLDLVMPHIAGTDLLLMINQEFPQIPVIVLSGLNQLETAVRCMKLGAFDYHVKTSEPDRLWGSLRRALEIADLNRENRELGNRLLATELKNPPAFAPCITRSPKMERIFRYMEAIASTPGAISFVGQKGTGRTLLARVMATLHTPDAPFVTCCADELDGRDGILALFGSSDSEGLFQTAQGGFLLIKEIQNLSPSTQTRLLDVLKQGEFPFRDDPDRLQPIHFRLLTTSDCDLETLAAEGRFRKDLALRFDSHRIVVPSLAERPEDIQPLTRHFLAEACIDLGRGSIKCPEHVISQLVEYPFPGNVSELKTVIYSAVRNSRSTRLALNAILPPRPSPPAGAVSPKSSMIITGPFPTLAEARASLVEMALERAGGSQTIAARLLGITPSALNQLLKRKE